MCHKQILNKIVLSISFIQFYSYDIHTHAITLIYTKASIKQQITCWHNYYSLCTYIRPNLFFITIFSRSREDINCCILEVNNFFRSRVNFACIRFLSLRYISWSPCIPFGSIEPSLWFHDNPLDMSSSSSSSSSSLSEWNFLCPFNSSSDLLEHEPDGDVVPI